MVPAKLTKKLNCAENQKFYGDFLSIFTLILHLKRMSNVYGNTVGLVL